MLNDTQIQIIKQAEIIVKRALQSLRNSAFTESGISIQLKDGKYHYFSIDSEEEAKHYAELYHEDDLLTCDTVEEFYENNPEVLEHWIEDFLNEAEGELSEAVEIF